MKLSEFAGANRRYEGAAIAADAELNGDVQSILINLGLLARLEKPFGIIAGAALSRFQAENGCKEPDFLGPVTAAKLIEVAASGSRDSSIVITIEALRAIHCLKNAPSSPILC
jgi:hypothetical protein